MNLPDYDPDAIDVQIAELITATHNEADPLVHPRVREALAILRNRLDMDVVFVSQFQRGRRVFRAVDSRAGITRIVPGQSDPLEASWCQYVVEGRLPPLVRNARPLVESGALPDPGMPIGTHLSTPVVLQDGAVYGTLCCFSHDEKPGVGTTDLRRLQFMAELIATGLQGDGIGQRPDLQLQPRH